MKNLTQVEGMSLEVLRAGIRWDFETVPQYLDMLERRGAALNVAAFVGHSSIRTYVMGEAASERSATGGEIEEMRNLVLQGLRAGRSASPRALRPRTTARAEANALAPCRRGRDARAGRLPARGARGVFMLTKGGQTAIGFLEELAAAAQRPVVIAALLHSTNPDAVFQDLQRSAKRTSAGGGWSARCRAARSRWTSRCIRLMSSKDWKPGGPRSGSRRRFPQDNRQPAISRRRAQ